MRRKKKYEFFNSSATQRARGGFFKFSRTFLFTREKKKLECTRVKVNPTRDKGISGLRRLKKSKSSKACLYRYFFCASFFLSLCLELFVRPALPRSLARAQMISLCIFVSGDDNRPSRFDVCFNHEISDKSSLFLFHWRENVFFKLQMWRIVKKKKKVSFCHYEIFFWIDLNREYYSISFFFFRIKIHTKSNGEFQFCINSSWKILGCP